MFKLPHSSSDPPWRTAVHLQRNPVGQLSFYQRMSRKVVYAARGVLQFGPDLLNLLIWASVIYFIWKILLWMN